MRTTPFLLLILCCLFVSSSTIASSLPISDRFTVEYVLKSGFFEFGKTKRTLSRQENGRFVFTSTTTAAGMFSMFYTGHVTETSTWDLYEDRARPRQYSYIDTNNNREVNLDFDWENKTVINTINGEPWSMEIKDGTQDKLLYQISIMLDLTNNNEIKTLGYSVADGGKLKIYDAKVQETETIETPAGVYKTLRIHRDDGKSVTTLWCAPSLNYLPVRIEHYKKGETRVNAYLTKVNGLPQIN